MRASEVFRLVRLNINQNKFKTVMTSIGIVAGAATIVMVIAIGRGGQMDVAEQFSSLNAGAIDVSYEYEGEENASGGFSFGSFFGGISNFFGGFGGFGGGSGASSGPDGAGAGGSGASGGSFQGGSGGGMPTPGGDFTPPGSTDRSGDSGSDAGSSDSGTGFPGGDFTPPGNAGSSDDSDDDAGSSGSRSDGGMPTPGGDFTPPGSSDGDGSGDSDAADNESLAEPQTESTGSDGSEDGEQSGIADERLNQEEITLTQEDVDDIVLYVKGITGATISYDTRSSVEGASLTEAQTYTVAGVKENFQDVAGLTLAAGDFITDEDDQSRQRICVLGASAAKELYGSPEDALDQVLYIEDRTYTIAGILESSQTVTASLTPDDVIFVPYETGIKYITGSSVSPVITVIAQDVNNVDEVETAVQQVLEDNYSNAQFTFTDAGSKMEAAESSNRILTMLLTAMAVIVFLIGGIGIMNVLFVSVRERTEEIGILKALGASRKMILSEFLMESAAISLIGGVLGVAVSFVAEPVAEHFGVRVEPNMEAYLAALGFAVLTGTLFGFYPAWKASRLVPVEALNAE